jgi:hypothetical protein
VADPATAEPRAADPAAGGPRAADPAAGGPRGADPGAGGGARLIWARAAALGRRRRCAADPGASGEARSAAARSAAPGRWSPGSCMLAAERRHDRTRGSSLQFMRLVLICLHVVGFNCSLCLTFLDHHLLLFMCSTVLMTGWLLRNELNSRNHFSEDSPPVRLMFFPSMFLWFRSC